MSGVRALPLTLACLLLSACATPPAFVEDGWGVQRRFAGAKPTLLSISEINAGKPPATGDIATVAVRHRASGRYRIHVSAERAIAAQWTSGAMLFDAELDRALEWLAALAIHEPRAVELRLGLMAQDSARRREALHPADTALVIDLLLPVPAQPRSRGGVLEAALATGLHEAAHVLRTQAGDDREGDEYRASLVAACFRIAGMRRGDRIDFAMTPNANARDFTRSHSARAASKVRRDLSAIHGRPVLEGSDAAGLATLRSACARKLGFPVR